ncbi:MAG: phosphate ABC transporter permease subunit PstC [Acidimicrobiales bacterium]
MTTTTSTTTSTTTRPPGGTILSRSRRTPADTGFRYLTLACGLLVLLVLGLIAVSMTREAWPVVTQRAGNFFFTKTWNPQAAEPLFGSLGFVYGTVVSALIGLAFAVPISVGIALLLTEFAPRWLRTPATFIVDLLAAIPSVVFGLWGVLVLAPFLQRWYATVAGVARPVPLLGTLLSADEGGGGSGRSFFTAGLILALMITPIITAISRAVFDTTPKGLKEAALALGCTRWEMIRATVFPHSRQGFTGAVLLGLGRAMGETIAAALVIGSSVQVTSHLFRPGDSMAAVIANQFGEATGDFRAALIGLGLFLFLLTIVVNLAARAIAGDAAASSGRVGR